MKYLIFYWMLSQTTFSLPHKHNSNFIINFLTFL